MPSEPIRRGLLAALQKLDPDEAARAGADATLERLLELVRSCQALPAEFVSFVLDQVDREDAADPQRVERAMSAWKAWLDANQLATNSSDFDPAPRAPRASAIQRQAVVEPTPLPRAWRDLVPETRARLLDPIPRPPFSQWILPQPLWRSTWTDAFAVIPADDHVASAATVLVPSEDALESPEALDAWRARVAAAIRLSASPVRAQTGLLSRVIGCAVAATPSYVIIERIAHGPRSLAERLRGADRPRPRQLLELAIALCDLLSTLAAAQIRIMDLRPEVIAFEHSEGLRLTQLLDPTAVWPVPGLIPELRSSHEALEADLLATDLADRAQVFLVAALVLAMLCDTTDMLRTPTFRPGPIASLAALAGNPELSNTEYDRIAEPLIADLQRLHPNRDDRAAVAHLVQTLGWALSEEPDERHQSPSALSAALRAPSGD